PRPPAGQRPRPGGGPGRLRRRHRAVSPVLAIDVPNPLGPVGEAVGSVVGAGARKAGQEFMDTVGQAILSALAKACDKVATELLHLLSASSGVSFDAGWWASSRGQHLVRTVGALGAVLMVGFL